MYEALFWIYLLNSAFIIVHEIDSGYWKEWELFHLPGGVNAFLLLHLPLMGLLLYGLVLVRERSPWGLAVSLVMCAGGFAGFAAHMYFLHQAFPDIVGPEYTLRGLDYVLGTHPVSNVSYVSSVGTQSKLIAYGNNRADYSFIPGGMIPGVVIVQPDYPELKADWPFLWFENEYVVDTVTTFILAASAANALAR